MLGQQLFNGVIMGSIYALFGLGFNLVFCVHRIMNLAHGGIFTAGAFIGLYAVLSGLPLWAALIVTALGAGLIAVLIDLTAFRPLRKRGESEFAALISSIGADMVIVNVALRVSEARVMR